MNNGKDTGKVGVEDTLRNVLEEQAAKIKEKVADIEWEEVPGEIKSYVKSKPWKSMAIALGLGFLAGYIIKSNNRD